MQGSPETIVHPRVPARVAGEASAGSDAGPAERIIRHRPLFVESKLVVTKGERQVGTLLHFASDERAGELGFDGAWQEPPQRPGSSDRILAKQRNSRESRE